MSRLIATWQARALWHQDALFAAALGLLVFWLGAHTLNHFWLGDDPPILAHLLKHSLFEIFFVPAAWQELSATNLTPWISLSFYVDYVLAGPTPWVFYLHHLISLWLLTVVATRLFMLFVDRWLAWVGAVLFLLGTPVLHVSEQLYTRHYLEGLLLCLLALYCFLQYQRGGKFVYQCVAVFCYALAMTAKETYVPLAVLLVFLANGSAAERARQVLPYFAVLALYLGWRAYMLSGHVGGYVQGSAYVDPVFWKDVAVSFAGIPALLFGNATIFISTILLGIIAAGFLVQPRGLLLAILVTALVLVPLVPLVAYPGITTADRYLFLPWFLLCCAFVVQTQSLLRLRPSLRIAVWGNAVAAIPCATLAVALLAHHRLVRASEVPYHLAVDTQMRYVWQNDASTAFVPDPGLAQSYGMVWTLGEVKQLLDPAASMPKAILDARDVDANLPVYAYSAGCTCMQDISTTVDAQFAHQRNARPDAPLSLEMTNDDGWIAWKFGPYDTGTYNVIADYIGSMAVPAIQRGLRTSFRKEIEITLRYTAPEGWVTYSPPLLLEPDGDVLAWSRHEKGGRP